MAPRVALLALVVGCATAGVPVVRPYRLSGSDSAPSDNVHQEGEHGYVVRLDDGVEYATDVALASGAVRLRTTIRNGSLRPVRYDVEATRIVAADGSLLRLEAVEDEAGLRASVEHARGELTVPPGERFAILRSYGLVEGKRQGPDLLLLARLALEDELRVDDHAARVTLRFQE